MAVQTEIYKIISQCGDFFSVETNNSSITNSQVKQGENEQGITCAITACVKLFYNKFISFPLLSIFVMVAHMAEGIALT